MPTLPIVPSLLGLVSILSSTYGQNIGEPCNRPSVCKLLENCSVYNTLLIKSLEKICGYENFDVKVCCPIDPSEMRKPTPAPILSYYKGSLARAMCKKNAKAVYGLVMPPMPLYQQPVNISLCGSTHKLIGGKKAHAKEFPHMAAIGFDSPNGILWLCGGSLISSKIVVTTAYCTWTQEWGNANWVRLGDLNLAQTNDDAMPQTIAVKERIRHPGYQRQKAYHDIALLRLEKEATYNAYVRPACLPVQFPDLGHSNRAIATGWDPNSDADKGLGDLLKLSVNLVPHENCNASYFGINSSMLPLGIVNEWQICAEEPFNDICQGFGGGPLNIFNRIHVCMYNVIGIASVGRGCGGSYPGVYTRVYNYLRWIELTAWSEYI